MQNTRDNFRRTENVVVVGWYLVRFYCAARAPPHPLRTPPEHNIKLNICYRVREREIDRVNYTWRPHTQGWKSDCLRSPLCGIFPAACVRVCAVWLERARAHPNAIYPILHKNWKCQRKAHTNTHTRSHSTCLDWGCTAHGNGTMRDACTQSASIHTRECKAQIM